MQLNSRPLPSDSPKYIHSSHFASFKSLIHYCTFFSFHSWQVSSVMEKQHMLLGRSVSMWKPELGICVLPAGERYTSGCLKAIFKPNQRHYIHVFLGCFYKNSNLRCQTLSPYSMSRIFWVCHFFQNPEIWFISQGIIYYFLQVCY